MIFSKYYYINIPNIKLIYVFILKSINLQLTKNQIKIILWKSKITNEMEVEIYENIKISRTHVLISFNFYGNSLVLGKTVENNCDQIYWKNQYK